MHLYIDIGNTRLKWALLDKQGWHGGDPIYHPADWAEVLTELWGGHNRPKKILAANVAGEAVADKLQGWCQNEWGQAVQFARSDMPVLGLQSDYLEPDSLGVDRWMAMVGARSIRSGALVVVDCGTAVTLDFLSEDNRYRGGVIMPGDRLARSALLDGTAVIDEDGQDAELSIFGTSTRECVNNGVFYSMAGGVERVIEEMSRQAHAEPSVVLTGGGARALQPLLRPAVQFERDLVLIGLSEVAKWR